MSQTILIESNPDLKKIYSLNLTTFVGTDVIHRESAEEAIALLSILPEVSLVITQCKVGSEETALEIYQFIKEQGLPTMMIILGQHPGIGSEVVRISEPVNWELLIKAAANLLGVTLQDSTKKVKADYIAVKLLYFYDITKTPCDIYLRIKKGPNEFQYVKRIHSKDIFDKNDIKKYEDQGLKEFYVSKDYIQYFTTFVTNNLIQKLEREDLSMEERILTTATGHEIVRETVQLIGFDEDAIALSDASINSMIKSVKDSPKVGELMKMLFSNKVSFSYQHCHLLALMCHYVLSKQSWYRPDHLETLSFASFFADVTLKSNTQMKISSMKELQEAELTDEESDEVMNHAKIAADLLSHHPVTTENIKIVILQSHGKHDGIGFEENPGEDLHPLSKVFIVADVFVKMLLNPALPSAKKDILPLIAARFTNPSYQKIIKALEQKF